MAGKANGTPYIDDPEEGNLGPAMLALSASQRRFVLARVTFPGITQGKAAKLAGYSDVKDGAKVRGHHLAHNEQVLAAIHEVAGKTLRSSTIMAANVLVEILGNPEIEPKDRIKAAGMLLDRTGFGAAQTINVNKTVTDRSGKAVLARLQELASKHGLDALKLLGGPEDAEGRSCDPVEAEFTEVGE